MDTGHRTLPTGEVILPFGSGVLSDRLDLGRGGKKRGERDR